MEARPLVTIVTPSLNQGEFLREAIESVLTQSYSPIEYLVMDGGSTDGTLDVLRGYAGRLRWTSARDGGQAAAIAAGFARSTGSILAWLNADDSYTPAAVAEAVASLTARVDTAVVYGDAEFVDASGRHIGPCGHVEPFDAKRLLSVGDFISQPAAFFRREAYDAVGGLDVTLKYAFDYELWLRFAARGHRFAYLRQKWGRVRLHEKTKTHQGGLERLSEIERIARAHGAAGLPAAFLFPAFLERRRSAAREWRSQHWQIAVREMVRAVSHLIAHVFRRIYSSRRL